MGPMTADPAAENPAVLRATELADPALALAPHRYAAALGRFVAASPTSYHAVAEVARLLEEGGFHRLDERDAWPTTGTGGERPSSGREAGGARRYVVRDGAIVAWALPAGATPTTPLRVLGAHSDSPGFRLKPQPTVLARGWVQAGVEVYGGPLLTSWLDRELELAGRLVTRDGGEHLVRTGPMLRIPQLAVHLDRDAHAGVTLDKQRHTMPVLGVVDAHERGVVDAHEHDVVTLLARSAGLEAGDVVGYDVALADTQEPRAFGLGGELLASGRLDNLSSVFAGLVALLGTGSEDEDARRSSGSPVIPVLACFDHEEVGSASRSGAAGPFLADVLGRVQDGLGGGAEDRARALAASWCLSADAGHSVHPNYPEKHDPVVQPVAGAGVLLKINANQRYTSDAHGAAAWARWCEGAGVATQPFVSNNDVPCGSTIGPITATRLGIRTLDVGVPLLSMHSARELAHTADLAGLARAAGAFFSS